MYGILLVNECCGTLGTAVNEAYFALFPMGAHVTGMTPGCENSDFYILRVEHIEVINGEQMVWIGSSMVSE